MKKMLAILLSLCLVFSLVPTFALADEDGEGDITVTDENGSVLTLLTEAGPEPEPEEQSETTTVTDESTLRSALTGGYTTINITGTISLSSELRINNKTVTISGGSITNNRIVIEGTSNVSFAGGITVSSQIIVKQTASVSGLQYYVRATIHNSDNSTTTYYMPPRSAVAMSNGCAVIQASDGDIDIYPTIKKAINSANDGETVIVVANSDETDITVKENVTLQINDNATVTGPVYGTVTGSVDNVTNGVNPSPEGPGEETPSEEEKPNPPAATYNVTFDVTPHWADVTIDVSDSQNKVYRVTNKTISLPDGEYGYSVAAFGFEIATGSFTVSGAAKSVPVTLNASQVTVRANHGSVGVRTYNDGWVRLNVTPNSGYELSSLYVTLWPGERTFTPEYHDGYYWFYMRRYDHAVVYADFASTPDDYRVYIDPMSHGSVSVDKTRAEEGSWVYITVKPDVGYALTSLSVTRPSGSTVKLERVRENYYRFVMPGTRVTIDATFARTTTPFTDIRLSDWYYEAVSYVYFNGLMEGVNSYQFAPDAATTRAMVVEILYRMAGSPSVSGTSAFSDVSSYAWYAKAVKWAADRGIVQGRTATTFDPNAAVTREELATLLYRYAQFKGYNVKAGANTNILSYRDVSQVSDYAYSALQWACGTGVVDGTSSGYLTPKGGATRAQLATMLMRFCNLYID